MNKIDIIKTLLCDNDSCNKVDCESTSGSKNKIVILQRGWIFVGKYNQSGSKCTLTNAKNIRTWGTTKGLGELAEDGPTTSTKLDNVNDISFHELTVVATIDCNDKVWNKL